MINDIKRRAPFYLSDWTDAWDYRVVPATVYMYFSKYVNAYDLLHLEHPFYNPVTFSSVSMASYFGVSNWKACAY